MSNSVVKFILVWLISVLIPVFSHSQEMLWGLASSGGEFGVGAIFKSNADGTGLQVMKSFEAVPGRSPQDNLIQAANGKLYGMTSQGGKYLKGVLYELDPVTNTYTRKFDFNGEEKGSYPYGGLIQTPDGKIYGLTSAGGINNKGIIFEFDPVTGNLDKKFDFGGVSGENPYAAMVRTSNGVLYGVTFQGGSSGEGVLFQFDPSTGIVTKKKDFGSSVGGKPRGPLKVSASGLLYGMAFDGGVNNKGTIYEYDPIGNVLTKRYDFSGATDGANPTGGLIQAADGLLYGMTYSGGSIDRGVLFTFDPVGGTFTKKLDFDGGARGLAPFGSLLLASNGKMYGTTEQGVGTSGALFQYDPTTNTLLSVLIFDASTTGPGASPRSSVIQATNGKLYGTATQGGKAMNGTLFEFDPVSQAHQVKVHFGYGTDGNWPLGHLVQALSGKLYGTTYQGGVHGTGILFEYNITSQSFTKKLDFESSLGTYPSGGMVLASNGKLYGMTRFGGDNNSGVIFEYDPASNTYVTRRSFSSPETGMPVGSLIQIANGKLYGVSENGGAHDKGTLFEYDPATNAFAKKVDFDGTGKGSKPSGTLLLSDNKLYGLTSEGGGSDAGVLFEYDPTSNVYTKKADFNGNAQGQYPVGSLIKAANNKMYGIAKYGGAAFGVLFEYEPTGGLFGLHPFSASEAVDIQSGLVESSNGKLYGFSTQGGTSNLGVLFEYTIGTNTYTKKQDFIGANGAYPYYGPLLFVSMQPQTITFSLDDKTYGDVPFTLTATASSGLPITYSSSNPSVATVSGNVLTIHQAGTSVITASQAGAISYHPATLEEELIVNKSNQSISFNALSTRTFGDLPFTVTATASSNLAISSYSSDNTNVATVSGNTITIVGAGSAVITATQAGNINYNPTSSNQLLTVNKSDQAISFSLPAKVYGDSPFDLTATASSGLPVTYVSGDTNVATVSGNTLTILKAGTVTITASQAGNTNYNPASQDRLLTVNKSSQAITFPLDTKTFGDSPFALTATASSGLPLTYSSSNSATATVSGSTVTIVGAGTSVLTAFQTGDDNYLPASLDKTLTVNKSNQVVTFSSLPNKTFGDAPFAVAATASSGLPVSTFTSSNLNVATVTGNIITIVGAGTSEIEALQTGSANYLAASAIQTLTVLKSGQSITFSTLTNRVYGDAPFALTATASSGLPVTYTSSNTSVATISGNTLTIVGAGNAIVTASQPGGSNFEPATSIDQALVVEKSPQTITFNALPDKRSFDIPFTLNATASSNLAVTYTSSDPLIASIVGSTVTIHSAGSTSITASQPGNTNFLPAADVIQPLTINVVLGAENPVTIRNVYPNPARSSFILEVDSRYGDVVEEITLYDRLGRLQVLTAERLDAGKYLCHVPDLPPGLYFVGVPGSKSQAIMLTNQ